MAGANLSAADIAQQIWNQEASYIAAATLMCFDYCLTFGREVDLVWRRGFSTSTILFYAVRYSALFGTIFVVLDSTPFKGISLWVRLFGGPKRAMLTPSRSCGIIIHSESALDVILLIAAAAFSSLRVYALWGRSRWVLAAALLLNMANPAIIIYTFVRMGAVQNSSPPYCGYLSSLPLVTYEKFTLYEGIIGARMSSVVSDVLVLLATYMRTWRTRAEAARINFKVTLAAILLRDGTLYFIALLLANVIGLGLSRNLNVIQPVSTWIATVTAIFTWRFILNLLQAADALGDSELSELGTLPSRVVFRAASQRQSVSVSASRSYGTDGATVLTASESNGEWGARNPADEGSAACARKEDLQSAIRRGDVSVPV